MKNILAETISEVSSLIREKEVSPVDITKTILNEIEKNKENNAFITVSNESVLSEAKKAEKDIMNGNYKGPLHGVPLAIKDNISVKNTRCTNGSTIYKDYISEGDAPVVKRLRSEGAIMIGKTNLDEFANHVTGKNKSYGTIRNPLAFDHSAGGSSGGSAVSVAENLAYGALGTDTSGSIRIPAACCGIVGLKPSYNLIPAIGATPLSWSLDHMGILSKDCKDLSLLFHSIVPGAKQELPYFEDAIRIDELTIGIPENYFFENLDKTVEAEIRKIIDIFIQHGARVENIKIPNLKELIDIQETIIKTEAGYYHQSNLDQCKEYYEKDNYDFFNNGLSVSEQSYNRALALKQDITFGFQRMFSEIDIILTPTLPITTPKLNVEKVTWGKFEEDILNTLSRFTGPFNVSGLPALSVPVGSDAKSLPIGLQIVGNMYRENQLISIGHWIMGKFNNLEK